LAIPTVRDWTATEIVTEAKLDEISTALNFLLAPPRCYAYKTASGALASATWDEINFGAEAYDSHAAHDNSSNTSRLVAPESGLYTIKAHLTFATDSAGIRGLDIRKNAAGVQTAGTDLAFVIIAGNGTTQSRLIASVDAQMTAGDYCEVFGYQNTGGALNVEGNSIGDTWLSFRWVARTV
jgi:alpha-D-ribose 1-methylphosphonate 5-triphosphate synthase subunit PhnG